MNIILCLFIKKWYGSMPLFGKWLADNDKGWFDEENEASSGVLPGSFFAVQLPGKGAKAGADGEGKRDCDRMVLG